jgi:GNAT superfamily N-acetyltransferase
MPDPEPTNPLTIGSWWRCSVRGPDGWIIRVVTVGSHAYPDGTHVVLDEQMAARQIGDKWAVAAVLDRDGKVVAIESQRRRLVPNAPPMWFVETTESSASPPAVNVMAFTGAGQAEGALFDEFTFPQTGATNSDQVGAIRWLPSTGRVDQMYVQPQWRRRGISSALVGVAGILVAARDWPRLWGDGQRTELGEAMRQGTSWGRGMADLTHIAPPMTPGEA